MQAPRHLNPEDQLFSDRAAIAATEATPEQRSIAWAYIRPLRGKMAAPGDGEAERMAETTFLFGAAIYLIVKLVGGAGEQEVLAVAYRLQEIHERHTKAIAARARAEA